MSGRGGRREGSGRKPGIPNKNTVEIRAVAASYGPAAIAALAELAGLVPGTRAEAETARISALKELLDRAYGRSTQPLSGDTDAQPLQVDFRWADATPAVEPETIEDAATAFVVTFAVDPAC